MSDVKAVRYLLANNAGLTAVVPATAIIGGIIPQGTALPAIGITHVSTIRRHPIDNTATEFCTSRVQVTVHASTYASQKAVLALVRAAVPRKPGTVNNVKVDAIHTDVEGPDFTDSDPEIYMGSIDYIVTYTE